MHNSEAGNIAPLCTMIFLSWNYRGVGNLRAVTVLSHLVREKTPHVLFLMETKQTIEEMKKIQEDLRYNAMLAVPCIRRTGGLAMLWKSEVSLDIQTYSLNHIDTHILNDPSTPWRLTGFYGKPEDHRKHESWNYLHHLHGVDEIGRAHV